MSRKTTVQTTLAGVRRNQITNNTQKVGLRLLSARGEWLPRHRVTKRIPSATSRVRDLRKGEFGGFDVECKSSNDLNRRTNKKTYYYRINPNKVNARQVATLFRV